MKLQVLLADDHTLFRDGMRYVLQQLSEQVDIICAGDFAETLKQAEAYPNIDLALLDLHMPGSEGVTAIRIFHERFPCIPLVVVSGSDHLPEIQCVMEYGAMGFIPKTSTGKAMVAALRIVLDGGIYFPPVLQPLMETINTSNHNTNKHGLTKRQLETLAFLAEGLSNKEISTKMRLAEGTIKVHVAAAFQALHVNSRIEAVRKAQKLGLIPPQSTSKNANN